MAFEVGQSITATIAITSGGVPYDPPTVYAFSHSPSNVVTTLSTTRLSAGNYSASFVPGSPGAWVVRFSDSASPPTGSTLIEETQFVVFPLFY